MLGRVSAAEGAAMVCRLWELRGSKTEAMFLFGSTFAAGRLGCGGVVFERRTVAKGCNRALVQ